MCLAKETVLQDGAAAPSREFDAGHYGFFAQPPSGGGGLEDALEGGLEVGFPQLCMQSKHAYQ